MSRNNGSMTESDWALLVGGGVVVFAATRLWNSHVKPWLFEVWHTVNGEQAAAGSADDLLAAGILVVPVLAMSLLVVAAVRRRRRSRDGQEAR